MNNPICRGCGALGVETKEGQCWVCYVEHKGYGRDTVSEGFPFAEAFLMLAAAYFAVHFGIWAARGFRVVGL